ncbi:hypothetical protein H5P28_11995 [Ruficoccus amylovorans]|uniref:Porin n=1 Tax=Ruficoccus amylovorans TaxID=1804625 RepID=A0A842HFD5_9BACT|nr:hypothetical protein [Ruficoccus amylovorans]MBC2594979.1 hypothetical protein [Ruficoccus amylovorans]
MHTKTLLITLVTGLFLAADLSGETATAGATTDEEILALRQALQTQQAVINELQGQMAMLRSQLDNMENTRAAGTGESSIELPSTATSQSASASVAKSSPDISFEHKGWAFEIYGYIKLDAAYDTQRVFNGDFARYVMPRTSGDDNQLSITARQTRLGLKIQGPEWESWTPGGRIEVDFYGDYNSSTPLPRLRLAYAQMENEEWLIRAGQDWDALSVVLPRTLNFATYANQGALWSRRPQVKAQWNNTHENGKLSITGAIAQAVSTDIDGGGQPDGSDSGVPNFEGAIAYTWNISDEWVLMTALSGQWGQVAIDQTSGTESVFDTYAGMFTATLDWNKQIKLLGSVWYGTNLGSFNGGIGQTINLTQDVPIRARGGWIQLQTFPWSDLNWNIAFGIDDPLDSDLSTGMRSINLNASTSIYYQLTSYLTLGIEYSYMQTGYMNQPDASNNRIQTSVIFEF